MSAEGAVDVTVPAKLYALGLIQEFLKVGYSSLSDSDRIQLRSSILVAARQLVVPPTGSGGGTYDEASKRILAMKIASLMADLALREFPQRWESFVAELFSPLSTNGIWCEAGGGGLDVGADGGSGAMIGVKICLECLKLITEDCTDSDFNAKVCKIFIHFY